jgi:hypothetical protein
MRKAKIDASEALARTSTPDMPAFCTDSEELAFMVEMTWLSVLCNVGKVGSAYLRIAVTVPQTRHVSSKQIRRRFLSMSPGPWRRSFKSGFTSAELMEISCFVL